jgi:hypothetical protein
MNAIAKQKRSEALCVPAHVCAGFVSAAQHSSLFGRISSAAETLLAYWTWTKLYEIMVFVCWYATSEVQLRADNFCHLISFVNILKQPTR